MSADQLVFDMSSMAEGTSEVFVRKDWISILDNQNQSYVGNQSVLDTSQLSNSNKFFNYREAYLTLPMLITLTQNNVVQPFEPETAGDSPDYTVGLKNWYGSIVHSLTVDYNGTTIAQQTPYCGLWNSFKLMTSLSYQDVLTNGSSMGFWPDSATSFEVSNANSTEGIANAVTNNKNLGAFPVVSGAFNTFDTYNEGLLKRQQNWNFDPDGIVGVGYTYAGLTGPTLTSQSNLNLLWKSYVSKKKNAVVLGNVAGVYQVSITAQVYLKHLHSFFERVPLLKGVFLKLTLNLNQSSVNFTVAGNVVSACTVLSPLGGVSPLMLASGAAGQGAAAIAGSNGDYILSLAVGKTCLNSTQASVPGVESGRFGGSILLNIPAYTFNPSFEANYMSNPIKKVVYTDIYQYQIVNQLTAGQTFNNLITNGIANIKSVLVLPFHSASSNGNLLPIQSPFEAAGGGPTSPLCLLTQFQIQISGQNAIYNTERYAYEQFINQLQGCNAINGDLTDGLTSSLVGQKDFEMNYCYYYVNCGRMLPVEEMVPKSVNILGTNTSSRPIDLFIFVEYGVEVSIDIKTGGRV